MATPVRNFNPNPEAECDVPDEDTLRDHYNNTGLMNSSQFGN